MANRITKIYAVYATEKKGISPDAFLYGDFELAFFDRDEAEEMRSHLASAACFGRDGDQTPAQVGITYDVVEIDADYLDSEEPEDYAALYDIDAHVASCVRCLLDNMPR